MTLVCLFTILLFSKSGVSNNHSSPESTQRHSKHNPYHHQPRLLMKLGRGDNEQQEHPSPESIDSIEKQPLVVRRPAGSPGNRRHALNSLGHNNHDEIAAEPNNQQQQEEDSSSASRGQPAAGRPNSQDGFNLFDDKHEDDADADQSPFGLDDTSTSAGKRSLGDLLQDARRQLKRQQESEREREESTTPTITTGDADDNKLLGAGGKRAPIDPFLSQVLGDLDAFGLFRSIKSQLLEQLQSAPGANMSLTGSNKNSNSGGSIFASGTPIIRRGKNSATIIMSFGGDGGALMSTKPLARANSSKAAATNETTRPSQSSALERLMLMPPPPPLLARMLGGDGVPARGFASITIKSIDGPGENPFAPIPLFAASRPPSPFLGPFVATDDDAPPPAISFSSPFAGPGGLMSMLLRASGDLASQTEQQFRSVSLANSTKVSNSTSADLGANNSNNNNRTEELVKPEASQQVKVVALNSSAAANHSNDDGGDDDDQEVETFDLGQLIARQNLASSLIAPLYLAGGPRRATRGPGSTTPLMMISSSSSQSGARSPFSVLSPPPFFMSPHGRPAAGEAGSLSPPPPPLSLGSLLSDMMSSMANDGAFVRAGSEPQPRERMPGSDSSSGGGGGGPAHEDEEFEEQPAAMTSSSSRLRPRHHSPDEGLLEGRQQRRQADSPLRQLAASSLLDQLLGAQSSSGGTTFGTIRQTFRGPNGATVQRVIEVPPRPRLLADVQAVPVGIRSQSISRLEARDQQAAAEVERRLMAGPEERPPAFARMMRDSDLDDTTGLLGPGPASGGTLMSGRLPFGEMTGNEEAVGDEAPLAAQGGNDSNAPDDNANGGESGGDDEEPELRPHHSAPAWRLRSPRVARLHLISPRGHSELPRHFTLPAAAPAEGPTDERQQNNINNPNPNPAEAQHPSDTYVRSVGGRGPPFESPSSPLFGFPALKPAGNRPQVQEETSESQKEAGPASVQHRPAGASSTPHEGQRQPRAFVYHSNHELAKPHQHQQQAQDQVRPRSLDASGQQQASAVPPAGASMVMGRRLDDFVERR